MSCLVKHYFQFRRLQTRDPRTKTGQSRKRTGNSKGYQNHFENLGPILKNSDQKFGPRIPIQDASKIKFDQIIDANGNKKSFIIKRNDLVPVEKGFHLI